MFFRTRSRSSPGLVMACFAILATACSAPLSREALPVSDDPWAGRDAAGSKEAASPGAGAETVESPLPDGVPTCAPNVAEHPLFCDGFEGASLNGAWFLEPLEGGTVHLKAGGAHGTASLAATFGTLPSGLGKAAVSYKLAPGVATAGAGARFSVHVVHDGYPRHLGLAALRGAKGAGFVVELDEGQHIVVRDTLGTTPALVVGDVPFDAWTCVSVELDAAGLALVATLPDAARSAPVSAARAAASLESVEIGLTYDEGANVRASVGIGFDDVVIGHALRACP